MSIIANLHTLNYAQAKTFEILDTALEISIGRNPENDLIINDLRVSGKHCKILREN